MSEIIATCACGDNSYHRHTEDDADWFGPSGWFRTHQTEEVGSGTFCSRCGTALLPGGERETRGDIEARVRELEAALAAAVGFQVGPREGEQG